MGQYLSAPITEKESLEGSNEHLAFGLSAMQGWRISMEDDHISNLKLDDKHTALFSVFDGHGGKAVAKFAAKHMPGVLVQLDSYKKGNFGVAIAEAYYQLDELLATERGQAELKLLAGVKEDSVKPRGLFSDVEVQLLPDDDNASAAAATTNEDDGTPASPQPARALRKVNSSSEFLRSALQRNSLVMPRTSNLQDGIDIENEGGETTTTTTKSTDTSKAAMDSEEEEDEDAQPGSHDATGMGCTAVTILIRGHAIVVANTGDSRCVISRKGEATPLTLDHKPVIFEEAQRIIKAGGFVRDNRVNGALNVSRTIGDLDFKKNDNLPHTEQMVVATPDITELTIQEGDEFLILACDGIWDVLSNQEAVDFVRKRIKNGQSLKEICEAMCDHCLAPDLKGLCRGADNMSVIVVLLKDTERIHTFFSRLGNALVSPLKFFGSKNE